MRFLAKMRRTAANLSSIQNLDLQGGTDLDVDFCARAFAGEPQMGCASMLGWAHTLGYENCANHMKTAPTGEMGRGRRRSTRVPAAVFLTVTGIDVQGQPFAEKTGTMELSFHGCRYFSTHAVAKDFWLTLQEIPTEEAPTPRDRHRARVASVRKSQRLPGMLQVGVELESPGNVWGLASPPEDWREIGVPGPANTAAFERDMKALLELAATGTYYQMLQVTGDSSRLETKHAYYELARKFHPDRHMEHPGWMGQLQKIVDAAGLAYKTLTNEASRAAYDRQLATSGTFLLGEQQSESRKTAASCAKKGRECFCSHNYGGAILWMREAVELEPRSAKYQALLARTLAPVAQYRREAAERFQKAIEIDPSNAAVHFQLAELYEQMRLPWRAQCHYQKVLEIESGHRGARERLRALTERGAKSEPSLMHRLFLRFSK